MQDDSNKRRKRSQEIDDDYHKKVYDLIVRFWLEEEINNQSSPFYKNSKIEIYIKRIYPKARQNILNIAKSYKFSILTKGKCYYTQQSMAEHFNIARERVSEAQSKLEEILETKFIIFPSKIINPTINKKSSGIKVLIPPMLYKMLLQMEKDSTVEREDSTVQRVDSMVQKDSIRESLGNLRYLVSTYGLLYYYFSYTFLLRKKDIKEMSNRRFGKNPKTYKPFCTNVITNNTNVLEFKMPKKFELTKKKVIERFKLKRKKQEIITFDDYKINPKQFMNHIEIHRVLNKWFDILIEANVPPMIEETEEVIKKWNNIENERFSRVNIGKTNKSKTYYLVNLAVSYRMWSMRLTIEQILQSIDNFDSFTTGGRLKFKKKIHLLNDFLWNDQRYSKKDHFKLSILDKGRALQEYYGVNTKYKNSLDYVRRYYGITFLEGSTKENRELFNVNYKLFVDFTNIFVEAHMKKDMVKFYDPDSNFEGFKKLIRAYFDYADVVTSKSKSTYARKPMNLLGAQMKLDFIAYTKNQEGWKNFWVDLEKSKAN